MSIPGFGPITASAMAATIQDTSSFAGPREFAAFFGLTPKQNSSGGKQKLGCIWYPGRRDGRNCHDPASEAGRCAQRLKERRVPDDGCAAALIQSGRRCPPSTVWKAACLANWTACVQGEPGPKEAPNPQALTPDQAGGEPARRGNALDPVESHPLTREEAIRFASTCRRRRLGLIIPYRARYRSREARA
jgi:hypothetical protein